MTSDRISLDAESSLSQQTWNRGALESSLFPTVVTIAMVLNNHCLVARSYFLRLDFFLIVLACLSCAATLGNGC